MGWSLAGRTCESGKARRAPQPSPAALAWARSRRTASVRTPRNASQASSGPGTAPCSERRRARASARSASRATTAPRITSECPDSSFVTLCTTTSTPRSSGRCSRGVAKVLSAATSGTPASWAPSARPSMSAMRSRGLVGDSIHSSPAPSQASRVDAVSVGSAKRTASRPRDARSDSSRRVPL